MDLKSAMAEAFVQYVLPPLAVAVGGLLVAALGALTVYLREKGKTSKAAWVGATFAELAHAVAAHLEVEMRPRVAKALEDGRLTPEEGALLKAEAMRLLREKAPPELLAAAKELFGPLLETWLSGLLERANATLPPMGAAPATLRPALPTPPARPSALAPSPS